MMRRKMRKSFFLGLLMLVFIFSVFGCPKTSDSKYDRQAVLEQFDTTLKNSVPKYARSQLAYEGFFVQDISQPINKYIPKLYQGSPDCINFIDRHVYHFSPIEFSESQSHIAFLEDGKLKVFENINCGLSNDNLEKALGYAEAIFKNDRNKDEILTRLKNYRRYGFYITDDALKVSCNVGEKIPQNSDRLYNRGKVLNQFADVLRSSVSENVQSQFSRFLVEEERGVGFFVWDLTEPSNKQTSLLERVEFKNNHVYHFAFIDSPFSFSNIAVLEDGKLKIFKNINCSSKGDSLKDVIGYLNQKLKTDNNKKEILKRVKNYRKYGVYASFNGLSTPQCKEAVKSEK